MIAGIGENSAWRRLGWLTALVALGVVAALAAGLGGGSTDGAGAASAAAKKKAAAKKVRRVAGDDGYDVVVRRTSHGIPHIIARNFASMGYGYAYSFAQDNICTIAGEYVTVNAERSRFFGPDVSWRFDGNGSVVNNLNSDFFFQRIKDRKTVEQLLEQKPPKGPRDEIREGVRGYVAGYNRYLKDTGVDKLPDPACRGKSWVRPIDEITVYRYFYMLALLASQGVAIDGIGSAAPLVPPVSQPGASANALERLKLEAAGSNAYGLGREATNNGRGMVLGNPHFPWQGAQRFYQAHLTIPGRADVSGASLFGVPIILIGHTKGLAWSHTVSTARRFTPFELQLVPGDPTSYRYDGGVRKMRADKVTVKVPGPGGSLVDRSRTLYSSHHGPIFTSILGLPLFPWTPVVAHAMGDVNAANFRYLNHFLEVDQSQNVRQLDGVLKRNLGIPWVNTIAADSSGEAYYADIGAIPHVTNDKASVCNSVLGRVTLPLLGIPILDGSRADCEWGNDSSSPQPGAFGPENLPHLFRNDYVTNSNDSYWLSNPHKPLTGYSRIIGDENAVRSLRTRLGLLMVEERLKGSDGRPGNRFTLDQLQDTVFNNRQYAGELWRDPLVAYCRSNPVMLGSSGPVNVSEACGVLANWNLRDDLDSNGAILFRRFAGRLLNVATLPGGAGLPIQNPLGFTKPFDASDGVRTPSGLNSGNPQVALALADSVKELRDVGIPLNAPLRGYQYEVRGSEKIPIHGGPGGVGVFNAINVSFAGARGYPDVAHGSSFVMAVQFTDKGPVGRSILTYSQSENPESPYYADQTRMFSEKKWNPMLWTAKQVLGDKDLRVTELGCYSDKAFDFARVRAQGKRRVKLSAGVRAEMPATLEIARAGAAGSRRVARARSSARRPTLTRKLADGTYFARFSGRAPSGKPDAESVAFEVRRGTVKRLPRFAQDAAACGRTIENFALGSPVFGSRGLRASYRATRRSTVSIEVRRDGKVVKRIAGKRVPGGKTRSQRITGLAPGRYTVRLTVKSGKRKASANLSARGL